MRSFEVIIRPNGRPLDRVQLRILSFDYSKGSSKSSTFGHPAALLSRAANSQIITRLTQLYGDDANDTAKTGQAEQSFGSQQHRTENDESDEDLIMLDSRPVSQKTNDFATQAMVSPRVRRTPEVGRKNDSATGARSATRQSHNGSTDQQNKAETLRKSMLSLFRTPNGLNGHADRPQNGTDVIMRGTREDDELDSPASSPREHAPDMHTEPPPASSDDDRPRQPHDLAIAADRFENDILAVGATRPRSPTGPVQDVPLAMPDAAAENGIYAKARRPVSSYFHI